MEKLNIFHQGVCDTFSIWQGLPHAIWDGESGDGGTSFLATRLIHNKPIIVSTSFLRCYLLALDPYFILQLTSFGVLLTLIIFLFIAPKKIKYLYFPFLLFPLLFLFPIPISLNVKYLLFRVYLYGLTYFLLLWVTSRLLKYKNSLFKKTHG